MSRRDKRTDSTQATSAGIVVLGMHRSGTSLLSGLLGQFGFEFGGPVIGSTSSNPKGHWEHAGVVHTHDRFLVNVGHHWSDPRSIPDELFRTMAAAQARTQLEAIFERDLLPQAKWVLKDPRQCRLLPLWDTIRADRRVALRFVHLVRDPFDVAASLAVRDRFTLEHSLLLWLRHTLDAELATRDGVRAWILFDDLVASPAETVLRLSEHLDIADLMPADMSTGIASTLDQSLVHHRDGDQEVQSAQRASVPWIDTTWKALQLLATGQEPQARRMLDRVRSELATLCNFAAKPVETFLRDQAVSHQRILEQKHTEIDALVSRRTVLEIDLRRVQEALTRSDTERTRLAEERAEVQAALEQARTERSGVENELAKTQQALAKADAERTRSTQEQVALRAELAKAQSQIDIMVRSRSWRWTEPLRDLRGSFRSPSVLRGRPAVPPPPPRPDDQSRGTTLDDNPPTVRRSVVSINTQVTENDEAAVSDVVPARQNDPPTEFSVRTIAFYLPQFHPIPENDQWWGTGFTEWHNVTRGTPQFDGHYQPRVPSELGFYDLRLPDVREAQAELAKAHGIYGFCYYYYWFDRTRLLHRPLDEVLESGHPDFPFCICWANESWSRRWDGSEQEILIRQEYRDGFAQRFAEDVAPVLRDPRYIRVGNRPLLLVYRLDQIPDPGRCVETWRAAFHEQGIGDVVLAAVEGFGITDPTRFGFDAAVEFPPHNPDPAESAAGRLEQRRQRHAVHGLVSDFRGILRDYRECARNRSALRPARYPRFRGVVPSWDNTARAGTRGMVYHHASPEVYQEWLTTVLESAPAHSAPFEPLVFINAWNEWAEGTYLEPDRKHGRSYLLATKTALEVTSRAVATTPVLAESPEVSIVIPAFNQVQLTRECLRSLRHHQSSFSFEVLVVDDGSTDDTLSLPAEMPWARFVRRTHNHGFGSACKLGANEARGDYLVFLNNDTVVSAGWLDALRGTFDVWPEAGLVGSKLVLPDGTMQECGSLVFRDGSAANYGRGANPEDPRYCYARETDYVSGAAMMIRRNVFHELGGFDERYEPAYYEDTDLAFRVRERGLQVIVNPHAQVRHHEGGTAGTDTSQGIKRYQVINRKKFFDRWKNILADYPGRPTDTPRLRKTGYTVLVVDWIIPRPDRDSASLRMTGILGALRRLGCHVTMASRDMSCEKNYELPLERIGVEVLRRPFVYSLERYLTEEGARLDYVIVSRRDTAQLHMATLERYCPNATIVYDTCDLHFVREGRQAAVDDAGAGPRELAEKQQLEVDLIARSDVALVVSRQEKEVLERLLPRHDIRIVSNIVEPRPTARPFSERTDLLFIGFFQHTPNVDAVIWFAEEVLPALNRKGFRTRVHVIGSDPPSRLFALDSEQVAIHGFVRDVEPFFDACLLSVAPLRYGAGVKGKINHSMALGLPCVTTTIGAEGLNVEHGVQCLIADGPEDFASQIYDACHSEELWTRLRQEGLRNIEMHFSAKVAEVSLRDLLFSRDGDDHESAQRRSRSVASPVKGGLASDRLS